MQLTDKEKYEIIIRHEMNHSIRTIANDMKINKNTVSRWISRYEINKTINRKSGSGRNKKTSIEQDKIIINELKNNKYYTAANIQNQIKLKNINISIPTIRNILNENDFKYEIPSTKPLLTDEHKKKDWIGQKYIRIRIGKI